MKSWMIALAPAMLLSACAATTPPAHTAADQPRADAGGTLLDPSGAQRGSVELWMRGASTHAIVTATGLTPGLHGMHIHAVGTCNGPDFASAGGHWNPDGKQHGHINPMGAHRGDLMQLSVSADGVGRAEFDIPASLAAMLDSDGASLVIHAKPDDDKTDPSGNSGARELCAVLAVAGA